jgi:hypothetical protein
VPKKGFQNPTSDNSFRISRKCVSSFQVVFRGHGIRAEGSRTLCISTRRRLGHWIKFTSAEALEGAANLRATDQQIVVHRMAMQQTGQGSSDIRQLPNRNNLLDWNKL